MKRYRLVCRRTVGIGDFSLFTYRVSQATGVRDRADLTFSFDRTTIERKMMNHSSVVVSLVSLNLGLYAGGSTGKMNGDSIDRVLSSSPINANTVILFYACWCPFSTGARSKFAALSSMFSQIKHLMVEQSSAFPR
ncbi:hypothetical protein RJ639_038801 [Escallonia herrerae]|uniref:Uncharacterized protein n=1 Tax=Escallonia herrerae TaxID=1293975 RepID=A0AA89B729_9ASTE|nr:hypothetical protein RJ639_038801 [Escallonia herrerae]